MRALLVLSGITCLALASSGVAQSTDANSIKGSFGEINVTPIKDLASKFVEVCQAPGQSDKSPGDSGVTLSFKVEVDGSMLAENIRIVRSSGSRAIDKLTVEILWLLGKSHLLGPLSTLGASTIEFRVHDGLTQFTTSSSAATPEEAASKVTQLTFLLKLIAIQQKPRNPIVSERRTASCAGSRCIPCVPSGASVPTAMFCPT